MRLYIPTSSLNADNILSCECIVPVCECRKRSFGYSQFEILNEFKRFENYTLAFTRIPQFSISDPLRENYPMVVEINIQDFKKSGLTFINKVNGTEIYATANSLIISPTNSKLLFFNHKALKYTYNNCADSAKSKLFEFFKNDGFNIVSSTEICEPLSNCIDTISSLPLLHISYTENDYNKIKGFIWGFAIGSFLSLTSDIAKLLKIQKRIYDIISSNKYENYFYNTFKEELEMLDAEYSLHDPAHILAKQKWDNFINSLIKNNPSINISEKVTDNIDSLLRSLGVETEAKSLFLKKQQISIRKPIQNYLHKGVFQYEQYNNELKEHTNAIIYKYRKEHIKNISFKETLTVDTLSYNTVSLATDDNESRLFNQIFLYIIKDNIIPSLEEIRVNRKDVATNVVKAIKFIFENNDKQWQGSDEQLYFDRMRKSINRYEPFDLNDIDNPILKSIAAFILKGEDFEGLKTYLETNAVSDYRYAFALWGAISGYISIPRTIIESIFEKNDVISLFNTSQTVLGHDCKPLTVTASISDSFSKGISKLLGEETINSPRSDNNIGTPRERILDFFYTQVKKGKKNQKSLEKELKEALTMLGNFDDYYNFVYLLKDFSKWGMKNNAWKEMQQHFCPDYYDRFKTTNNQIYNIFNYPELAYDDTPNTNSISNQKDFFKSNRTIRSIHFTIQYITDIANIIKELNPDLDEYANKQIYNDLEWVFEPKYSKGKSESELLDQFRLIIIKGKTEQTSKKGKNMTWKNKAYRSLDIEETINFLRKCLIHK